MLRVMRPPVNVAAKLKTICWEMKGKLPLVQISLISPEQFNFYNSGWLLWEKVTFLLWGKIVILQYITIQYTHSHAHTNILHENPFFCSSFTALNEGFLIYAFI